MQCLPLNKPCHRISSSFRAKTEKVNSSPADSPTVTFPTDRSNALKETLAEPPCEHVQGKNVASV